MPKMSVRGCDSAFEPELAQADTAKQQGIAWWGCYVAGPGAVHNWSEEGTAILATAGLRPLPIYVPAETLAGTIASHTPETDAETFVAAYRSRGIDGAGVLDTEASMRGDPWTVEYERRFTAAMGQLSQSAITYCGGFTPQSPPTALYRWWIIDDTNPGQTECFQQSQGQVAGIQVDFDYAGDRFPLAEFGYNPANDKITEVEMFVRNPSTGEICLCSSSGAVNLGDDWPAIEAAYAAPKVPLVLVESASLQERFLAIAAY